MRQHPPQRSLATPFAVLFALLIIYASWYPFSDWRSLGLGPLHFLWQPLPRWWTWFDVLANFFGYAPFGLLLFIAFKMADAKRPQALLLATFLGALLSLCLEMGQTYIPQRIASNLDFALNTAGTLCGALLAALLETMGLLRWWRVQRKIWFTDPVRGPAVLICLWPLALLVPSVLPFGLGVIYPQCVDFLFAFVEDTPWAIADKSVLFWPGPPPGFFTTLACAAAGLLAPMLLGYGVMRNCFGRLLLMSGILLAAFIASSISAALSYGPEHTLIWLQPPVAIGAFVALMLGALLAFVPALFAWLVLLMLLPLTLLELNQAPLTPYTSEVLQAWGEGRFVRFHGLIPWLSALWPWATLLWVLGALLHRRNA